MSDFDMAVERLTTWLRDYAAKAPREFVGDVSIVLSAAREARRAHEKTREYLRELDELTAEVERLRAIVDTLPKTADGVTVVPGVDIYVLLHGRTTVKNVVVDSVEIHGGALFVRKFQECLVPLTECFSAREAAEEARGQ